MTAPGFGPWADALPETEFTARLRSLRALALVYVGPHHPIVSALRDAELDPIRLAHAATILETLPALRLRRMLATYAELTQPRRPAGS